MDLMHRKTQGYWNIGVRFFLAMGCLGSVAHAEQPELKIGELDAQILPASPKDGTEVIPKLALNPGPFPITLPHPGDPDSKPVVTLEGTFQTPNWTLLLLATGKSIPLTPPRGQFRIRLTISQAKSSLYLAAVARSGQAMKAKIHLAVREWPQMEAKIRSLTPAPSRFHWGFGAGLTHLNYIQDGIPSISSILVSTKGGIEYWLKPQTWSIGLSGYFSSLPLMSSPSGYSLSFLGVNARVGYHFPEIATGWHLGLMAGYYFATTFPSSTSAASFGYANLGGPQLYPTLSRRFGSGSSASLYLKFSPVSDQLTILSLSNHEIASGLSYQFRPDARQRGFSLGLDWAKLTVSQSGVQGSSTTLSLSTGYRWR